MINYQNSEKDMEITDKIIILQSSNNATFPTEVLLLTYTEKYKAPNPVMDSEIFFTANQTE